MNTLVVRAIRAADLDALYQLTCEAGSGMTTLKPDMDMLGERLQLACASFAETIAANRRDYVFVMEDTGSGRLAGVCAIKSAVGLEAPFYNYRIGTLVHASRELGLFTCMETLYLSNDLTGCSELCSLFLHPDYRSGSNGKLLSKSRFLFIAQFPHLFSQKLIAEMRGFQAPDGSSPFYEGLGRHFFQKDFDYVDGLSGMGKKSFIADLMPRHPVYVACLAPAAQQVIGQVHASTVPARRLLEQEGFHFEGYIDIFDAGPVLQTRVSALRAVRESMLLKCDVMQKSAPPPDAGFEPWLLSNTLFNDFRVIVSAQQTPLLKADVTPGLSPQEQAMLHCQAGAPLRALALNAQNEVKADA